jgi:hypothetical protein
LPETILALIPSQQRLKAAVARLSEENTASQSEPLDRISAVCTLIIAAFAVLKIVLLASGQPVVMWLDFANPSLAGLIFTAAVLTLFVRRRLKRIARGTAS